MNVLRTLHENLIPVTLSLVLVLILLSGCSGAGNTSQPQLGAQGTVDMFVTDAETDKFNQIMVTITKITLLGSDSASSQVIFQGTQTVDLRKLTDFSAFLAKSSVSAGNYSKIRLAISKIVLNQVDDNGNLVDTQSVTLPSGHIDLNPRQTISLASGDQQTIEIDFDARNSFKMAQTGSGKVVFRPVVFVHLKNGSSSTQPGRLVRQHGTITSLDLVGDTFKLCHLSSVSTHDQETEQGDDCLNVSFSDQTLIYDQSLGAMTTDGLVENSEVTVLGYLNGEDSGSHIDARAMVMGPSGTITSTRGSVVSTPDANGTWTLAVTPGQDVPSGNTTVQLADTAQIFSRSSGDVLASADLVANTPVVVIGQFDSGSSTINAIVVSVADANDEVTGTVSTVDTLASGVTLTVDPGDGSGQCVSVDSSTHIAVQGTSDDDHVDLIGPTDINVGADITAQGTTGSDGCLNADNVVIDGASGSGS
ncbi:MAG TPA: DUF4382 domain-containing protein [Pseudomonadales bacterium]|nr:DUF4382 domain-containing protein [Pseudomonadales bacterium]